jgi:hypothetical protein
MRVDVSPVDCIFVILTMRYEKILQIAVEKQPLGIATNLEQVNNEGPFDHCIKSGPRRSH